MSPRRTIHVIADAKGNIVGAAALDDEESSDPQAQVRVTAMDGQRLVEVDLPQGVDKLKTLEDFDQLCEKFHLPAGEDRLATRERSKPRERSKQTSQKEKPARGA